jgi:predicted ATP-grasp superfamily ATP-dependent carboligase
MALKILLVGSGQSLEHAHRAASAAGMSCVLASPARMTSFAHTFSNSDELERIATEHGARHIYACSKDTLLPVSKLCQKLGLPGISPEVAERTSNKRQLYEVLKSAGIAVPHHTVARTIDEAAEAVRIVGLPLVLKPCDGQGSRGVQVVEHVEDLPLFFKKSIAASFSKSALVEQFLPGDVFRIDGYLKRAKFEAPLICRAVSAPWPMCNEVGFVTPPDVSSEVVAGVVAIAENALDALGAVSGGACVEVISSPQTSSVISVSSCLASSQSATLLAPIATGVDWLSETIIRDCGLANARPWPAIKPCALYWMQTGTGFVERIEIADVVRTEPKVVRVQSDVTTEEVLGHTFDAEGRERIGYVIARGESPEDALNTARWAWARSRVVTRSTK